jgi:hypothetical protein
MTGMQNFEQYWEQYPSVVTFEPGTPNLEPLSLEIG